MCDLQYSSFYAEKSKKIIVDSNGYGDFRLISEAIEKAVDKIIIFVKKGIYKEHFVVNKAITIVGELCDDGSCPIIYENYPLNSECIRVNSAAKIKNFVITSETGVVRESNNTPCAVVYITANAVIENVSICGWFDSGICSSGKGVKPEIKKCRFYNNSAFGMVFQHDASGIIDNCDVFDNKRSNVVVEGEFTSPFFKNCRIYGSQLCGIVVDQKSSTFF